MPQCHGNGSDHCCWINGVCPHLEENTVKGRRWACGLLRELGSWEAVYADKRYQQAPVAHWFACRFPGLGCGDWPQKMPSVMNNPAMGKCCYEVAS